MKRLSLLSLAAALLLGGSLMAQEPQVLISDGFDDYTVGNKIAVEAQAAGNDWWTTWSSAPGSSEDGVVSEYNGSKCGYLTYGVDQVLLLGDEQNGVYDLEFDILIPNGKNGYFNILHDFNGSGSTWALESYLHMSGSGTSAPGVGAVYAGSSTAITFTVIYDDWMHFRLHVDTDADHAEYYYTAPGESEVMIAEWQWSLNAQGSATVGRKLAAMDFYPPQNAANSIYYLDNFSFTKVSGDTAPVLTFDPDEIVASVAEDESVIAEINISNANGTSMGDWAAWVDFGEGQGGTATSTLHYDIDPDDNTSLVGYNWDEPRLVEVAVLFPGSAYAGAAMGASIVSAQYYIVPSSSGFGIETNTPLTFRVYRQGLYGQPGEVLAEKVIPYNQINQEDWTIATFDTPVALTGYNVWVSCEYTQAVGGYAMVFDGTSYVENSGFVRTGGGGAFEATSPDNMSDNYGCLHLRATTQGNPILATWAKLNESEGSVAMGGSATVNVEMNAIGYNTGDVLNADVVFITNDPETPEFLIPLTLTVGPESVTEMLEGMEIYPNPATTMVTVKGDNLSSLAIYNVAGQLVRIVKLDSMVNNIDMNVEAGVYFFSIYDNNGNNSVQRVVITK